MSIKQMLNRLKGQSQQSGDNSTNIQAGGDVNISGDKTDNGGQSTDALQDLLKKATKTTQELPGRAKDVASNLSLSETVNRATSALGDAVGDVKETLSDISLSSAVGNVSIGGVTVHKDGDRIDVEFSDDSVAKHFSASSDLVTAVLCNPNETDEWIIQVNDAGELRINGKLYKGE